MIIDLSLTLANTMLKAIEKTLKMILSKEEEMLEKLVKTDHAFRKLNGIVDFETLLSPYRALYSDLGKAGIDLEKGFKSLLVQFWEDLSDRQMEKALQENVAVKWFCGFRLMERTPDHSYLGKLRSRKGTFSKLRKRARFRGQAKVLFQCIAESICHNLKKALVVLPRGMPA